MSRLFISYSRVDADTLKELAKLLGFVFDEIWYDKTLVGGEDWWQEIKRQIKRCDYFLYLLSRDSIESMNCQRELALARRYNKRIVPIRIRDRTECPEWLARIQYVDWFGDYKLEGLAKIIGAIVRTESEVHLQTEHAVLSRDAKVFAELWELIDDRHHNQFAVFPRKLALHSKDSFYYLEVYLNKRRRADFAFVDDELEFLFNQLDKAISTFCETFNAYADEPLEMDDYVYFNADHPQGELHERRLAWLWDEVRKHHRQIYRVAMGKYPHFFA